MLNLPSWLDVKVEKIITWSRPVNQETFMFQSDTLCRKNVFKTWFRCF